MHSGISASAAARLTAPAYALAAAGRLFTARDPGARGAYSSVLRDALRLVVGRRRPAQVAPKGCQRRTAACSRRGQPRARTAEGLLRGPRGIRPEDTSWWYSRTRMLGRRAERARIRQELPFGALDVDLHRGPLRRAREDVDGGRRSSLDLRRPRGCKLASGKANDPGLCRCKPFNQFPAVARARWPRSSAGERLGVPGIGLDREDCRVEDAAEHPGAEEPDVRTEVDDPRRARSNTAARSRSGARIALRKDLV